MRTGNSGTGDGDGPRLGGSRRQCPAWKKRAGISPQSDRWMKVLCVVASYWPAVQFGGLVYAAHGLNKALVERGVDVTVYTTDVGLRGKVPVTHEVDLDGVRVVYFPFSPLLEVFAGTGWQFSLPLTAALKENVRRFDVVHIAGIWNYPTAAASHYARRYRVPYVIQPAGSLYPYSIRGKGWKKRPYYLLVSRRDIRRAAALQYVSADERDTCHSAHRLRSRAIVLPSGMDAPRLPGKEQLRDRHPELRDKKIILFLGRVHRIKGLDVLARAYGRLARERGDVHLLIVGPDEGGHEATIRRLLGREGAGDRVTFTGLLHGEEKWEALAGSDLFVLPSSSEGFSVAILEALACGLPVIISPECHFPEVAERGAGLVTPAEVDPLTAAIRSLLDSRELRRSMGENGRRLVREQYAWDSIARQMIGEYEKILKTGPSMSPLDVRGPGDAG